MYSDPNHPEGCRAARILGKNNVSMTLQDEPDDPVVKVAGSVSGNRLQLDLSPKGGPKELAASVGDVDGKIIFPDGSAWTKL